MEQPDRYKDGAEKAKQAVGKFIDFLKSLSPFMMGGILIGLGLGFMMHQPIGGLLIGIGFGYILEQIFKPNDNS